MPSIPSDIRKPRFRWRGLTLVGVVAAFWALLIVVAFVEPTDRSFFPKCQLHQLTGLHCPACGTTRAVHSALNGEFRQAIAYNAIAPLVLGYLAVTLFHSLWSWYRDRPMMTRRGFSQQYLPWILGSLLLAFFVIRNLPYYPCTLLAPHKLEATNVEP